MNTTLNTLYVLGRQPALGRAELESVYGAAAIKPFGEQGLLVEKGTTLQPFSRFGGSMKQAEVLATLDTTDWNRISSFVRQRLPGLLPSLPETGKIQLGLSAYGINISPQKLLASGLELKKALRKSGHSVRLVENKELALSSAQILYNKLTGPQGYEIVLFAAGNQTLIARTLAEQDINSYTTRDRERPKRDPRVGMLPPKLAQIIINLALGQENPHEQTVLDPFCGTGVVLQEAALMGAAVYGTDLEERMIRYTRDNISWLKETFSINFAWKVDEGDATTYPWDPIITAVACETYLGQPLIRIPEEQKLQTIVHTCNQIIKKFLENLGSQIPSGTRLCLAVPAWKLTPLHHSRDASSKATRPSRAFGTKEHFSSALLGHGTTRTASSGARVENAFSAQMQRPEPPANYDDFRHLPLVDQISDLGYNRVSFATVRSEDLIYHRENQIVARELLVLTKR